MDFDATAHDILQEERQLLYRARIDAILRAEEERTKFGTRYKVVETKQSVAGQPEREYWMVVFK